MEFLSVLVEVEGLEHMNSEESRTSSKTSFLIQLAMPKKDFAVRSTTSV